MHRKRILRVEDLDSVTADLHDALAELADLARAATPAPARTRRSAARAS